MTNTYIEGFKYTKRDRIRYIGNFCKAFSKWANDTVCNIFLFPYLGEIDIDIVETSIIQRLVKEKVNK